MHLEAQKLSGKVVDASGRPVTGAVISLVDNPLVKFTSGDDGSFELNAAKGSKVRVVAPGYEKTFVPDNDFTVVRLGSENELLNENNTQLPRQESTAAISTIHSKEIMRSSELNVANALFGYGLGLTSLQNAGNAYDPTTTFYIRGIGTLHGASPLVLVDGYERPFDLLSKEEIASVSILKDAASLAMYGLRGADGAIYITTKKGQTEKTRIEFSYDHASLQLQRKPQFADAFTYASAVNEAMMNDGATTPLYSNNQLNAYKSGIFPDYYPNVNWMDQVFKNNASSDNYNLSIHGGSEKVHYFTNLNYSGHGGFMRPQNIDNGYSSQVKFSRLNVRTNLDVQLTSTTKFNINLFGSLAESNRPGSTLSQILPVVYNTPANAFPVKTSANEWGGSSVWTSNPVAMVAAQGYGKSSTRTLMADWVLSQDLSELVNGLSADLSVRIDNSASYWESISKTYRYSVNTAQLNAAGDSLVNPVSTIVGTNSVPTYSSSLGSQWRYMSFYGKLNYEKTWSNVSLNSNLFFYQSQYIGNGQFTTDNIERLSAYTHWGFYNKYFLDLSLTANGSDKLQPNHNIGLFPSVGAAWILSNEDFLKKSSVVNYLKLIGSWGIVGDDYTSAPELYKQTFGAGGTYYLTDNYTASSGMKENRMATTGLTYEKSNKANVGVNGRFWNNLELDAELFYETRTDILVSTAGTVSGVVGATSAMANQGIVNNRGVELGLNYSNSVGDFSYNLGGEFTYTKSKIINMDEGFQPFDYLKQTGLPVNQIFGYQAIGYFKDQADIAASPAQLFSTVMPGDIKFKDQNNDGKIDQNDRVALGYNTVCPDMFFAFNLNLEYKGFGIDANFQGAADYSVILNTSSFFWPLRNNTTISTYYYQNRWTPDNQNALFPRLSMTQNLNNFNTNSVWIKDGSFVKLRNCEIYYRFSHKMLSKINMASAKIYVRGMNLFSLDHLKVVDPESIGVNLPLSSSINVGFNVGF